VCRDLLEILENREPLEKEVPRVLWVILDPKDHKAILVMRVRWDLKVIQEPLVL
jgi:hypothetical protein